MAPLQFFFLIEFSLESLLNRLPVYNIPNGLEVFGLAVLILETVFRLINNTRTIWRGIVLTNRHAPKHQFLTEA
jgi:hypothetical protein